MKELLFLNPEMKKGLNVTVRNGSKWMGVSIGEKLSIKETGNDKELYQCEIIGKSYIPFYLIPDKWLRNEHDKKCRTMKGLLEYGMKPAYKDFTQNNYVTVLFFEILIKN